MQEWSTNPSQLSQHSQLTEIICLKKSSRNRSSNLSACPLLKKYRTIQPNMGVSMVQKSNEYEFLPNILCKFFGQQQGMEESKKSSRCECNKTEDGYCQLVIGWVDEQYFWKTDRQFRRTYEHYSRKCVDRETLSDLKQNIWSKINTLGVEFDNNQVDSLAQILSNYQKHVFYEKKEELMIKDSDIYVWVGLGIAYHIGIRNPKSQAEQAIIFWAIDIAMNKFENLTSQALQLHHQNAMKRFQHYFSKWLAFLEEKQVSISAIIWEWLNQLMMGYMGIESIGFFLDCFRKAGWSYVYKVMLSYFEHRIDNGIKKSRVFLTGEIEKKELQKMLIDSSEEWPMIFCKASSFNYNQ